MSKRANFSEHRRMRLGTRLLLPLLALVVVLMALYGVWSSRMRARALLGEAHRETQAYATALGVALGYALEDPDHDGVRDIMTRIEREPKIYGVLVYDRNARVLDAAEPLSAADSLATDLVRRVLRTEVPLTVDRRMRGQAMYSVLRPIRGPGGRSAGVLEVVEPLSFVHGEMAAARRRLTIITLVLLLAVSATVLWLVRRVVARPLDEFLTATRAVGRGELAHRVGGGTARGELGELADEFNRMAAQLEAARVRAAQQAEERVQLERRLRETEKLAAVGNLAAGLAHEIAAPLNVVGGRAQMLLKQDTSEESRERNVRIITDQIGRITLIVRNLLDFARRREPRIREVDVCRVLDSVAEFLEGEFERAGVTVVREGERSAYVHGDPDLLHQVFTNIFMNAVQALRTVEAGRIIVRVQRPAADAEPVAIELEDNGPGIPEDILPHLFEPFVTTRLHPSATGLGLAVARSIVEEHGGEIGVGQSTAHATGACFRLTLPSATIAETADA